MFLDGLLTHRLANADIMVEVTLEGVEVYVWDPSVGDLNTAFFVLDDAAAAELARVLDRALFVRARLKKGKR